MAAPNRPIRVLVVDDHPVVRSGLAAVLRAVEDMELVGEAPNGERALQACREHRPDVVLMDMVMPGMDGVTATQRIRQEYPGVRVLALTSFTADHLVHKALQAGAIGYLLKNVTHEQLAEAIRAAHAGRALTPEATQALIEAAARPPQPDYALTPREREVLALMVEGRSNLEIAERLVITESTCKSHVSNIIAKLQVSNRTEAVSLALKHHLLD